MQIMKGSAGMSNLKNIVNRGLGFAGCFLSKVPSQSLRQEMVKLWQDQARPIH